jgi:hypothetical protein
VARKRTTIHDRSHVDFLSGQNPVTEENETTHSPRCSPHDLPPYPGIVVTACFMKAASAIDSKLNRVGLPLQIDVAGAFFGRGTGLGRPMVVDSLL